jgi:predicted ABC-type ATPase
MARPVLYVLAGVNGAGKSSIGGHILERDGLTWFNPDKFARELKAATGCDQETANAQAWQEGMRRLDRARGQVVSPEADDLKALQGAPQWTRSIIEAALRGRQSRP